MLKRHAFFLENVRDKKCDNLSSSNAFQALTAIPAVSEWKLSPKEQKLNKERNGEGEERINKCPAWTEALEDT